MRKAILIMGPPGSGKGTQANLVARYFNLIHFDTGWHIEETIKKRDKKNRRIKREFKEGQLTNPAWVLDFVKKEIERIARAGFGVVLSGSPRSVFEAFGDKKNAGLMPYLVKLYGKKNIFIFNLVIPPEESLKRNSHRLICSTCGHSHILKQKLRSCPFCGGKLVKRIQDKPSIIKVRLKVYRSQTRPVLKEFENHGFKVNKINGMPKPFQIFKTIRSKIK
ncbi:MAG: nucleoside monophosphate kinase [Candidatus Colwellbacteria bacterium]|nr:nucleoside monophosphate kinase [Candidatus Colwellbacteria bacterium]